jgi:hypothetical protein
VAGTFLGLSVPDGVPASKRTERTQRAVREPRRAAAGAGNWGMVRKVARSPAPFR